jgi:hypothetical protein
MTKMTTPQERLARMRKSFARNKSVLTEDYKYFITRERQLSSQGSSQMGNPENVNKPDKHARKDS